MLARTWPLAVIGLLCSCQVLFGDFEVVDGDTTSSSSSKPETCAQDSTFLCDGVTLYVCVEAGLKPTELFPCESPSVCDAVAGKCVEPMVGSTREPTNTSATTAVTTSAGGASVQSASSSTTSTVSAAGAPPDDGPCNPEVDDCCPNDPEKTGPGLCGCGVVDTPECAALRAALAHRYSFDDVGASALDSVAGAHGNIENTEIETPGVLELAGAGSEQYVDLPNGILSALGNATVEVWLVWHGGDDWQRVFDFGSGDAGEDLQGVGMTYLFLTPSSSLGTLRVAWSVNGTGQETLVETAIPLPSETLTHLAVVVDDDGDLLSLYLDGALQGSAAFVDSLSSLNDLNNWLGRSQFAADAELGATLEEVRIYSASLSAAQVAASYQGGPDPPFFAP